MQRSVRLDAGYELRRDPATGELRMLRPGAAGESVAAPAIRVGVDLVTAGCNVFGADGSELRGLDRENFRIFEDGAEQPIAYFDPGGQPLELALLCESRVSISPFVQNHKMGLEEPSR